MTNSITRLLGIRYPIILGGMGGVGTAPLVSAVSDAGGLGLLGSALWTGEQLKDQIYKVRESTSAPFGANIPVASHHVDELVETVIQEKVPVVATSAGNPTRFTSLLKKSGIWVIHVSSTVEYAVKAEQAGVDAVVAEGSESGGTTSLEEISTMALVPQVTDAVRCPVIAAGGIGDGRGLVAALALGASGVQMGTVFLAAEECEISRGFKAMMVNARETDTTMVREEKRARRIFEEGFFELYLETQTEVFKDLKNDEGAALRGIGQITGLVSEVKSAREIIEDIMQTAQNILPNLNNRLMA